jgi:hypothetical protein
MADLRQAILMGNESPSLRRSAVISHLQKVQPIFEKRGN